MNKYNLGIIGAGMYGKVLMRCFQQDERAKIVWVNSASEATTKAAAQEFGLDKWTLDYRDVLVDPKVEAVVIATPPYLHAEQLSAALAACKHVLLEKPMAESPESAAKIVAAVEKAPGLLVLEASCRHTRLTDKFRFIKAIIDSGKLGQIYHIHHNHLIRLLAVYPEYAHRHEFIDAALRLRVAEQVDGEGLVRSELERWRGW